MHPTTAAALVAAFVSLGASIAAAQSVSSPEVATKPQQPVDQLMVEKIIATLSHRGITGVSSIWHQGDGYQVAAVKDTYPVRVWVDPQSGQILAPDGR